MIIKVDPKPITTFSINIADNQIAQTNCTKYLGVILDGKLSWYQHITNVEDKLAQSLGIIYMTRHYLTPSALKSVYICLVYSHLQDAIGAWGSVPKTTLNHLNALHNKLIRAMNFASYRSHVTPLYHQSNLLKINIYLLEIAKMMHCLHNGKLPQTFDDYFVPVASVHTHLTRKPPMVNISCTRFPASMAKDQSGIMDLRFGIQLIIHCSNDLLFKKLYRAHLISQYTEEDTAV